MNDRLAKKWTLYRNLYHRNTAAIVKNPTLKLNELPM